MGAFFQDVVGGIVTGAALAMMAVAMQVVYATSGIMNFAVGSFVVSGSFVMYLLISSMGLSPWVALVLVLLGGAVAGVLYELLSIRPLFRNPKTPAMAGTICTVAGGAAIAGLFLWIFGTTGFDVAPLVTGQPVSIGGVTITLTSFVVVGMSLVVFVCMYGFFRKTWIGRGMIAVAQNKAGATVIGINTRNAVTLSFMLCGAICFVAGAVIGPLQGAQAQLGQTTYILAAFTAAFLGGLGSPVSAGLGGLALGVGVALIDGYLGSAYETVWLFIILGIVLYLRPHGLFGARRVVQ